LAVPADPEAVRIDLGLRLAAVPALRDQALARLGDEVLEKDRLAEIGQPAAHAVPPAPAPAGPQPEEATLASPPGEASNDAGWACPRLTMRACISRIMRLAVVSNRHGMSACTSAAQAAPNRRVAKPSAKTKCSP